MQELVEIFSYWTEQARQGKVLYVGVAAALVNDQLAIHQGGHRGFEINCQEAVQHLAQAIDNVIGPRRLDPRNYDLEACFVEFPLSQGISWDFLTWLVDAEMTRRRRGAPPPLRVSFTKQAEIDPRRVDFFNNVCRPLLPLIGAVEDVSATGGRHNPFATLSMLPIVLAARGGEQVPKLRAKDEARDRISTWLHGSSPVVVTLREVSYFPHRNSNLDAWLRFAHDLRGEDVIFVRDTAKAREPLPGFVTCPQASYDVQYRMALYEQAKVNFCVANGPGELLYFSNVPYRYFVNLKPDDTTTIKTWEVNNGLSEGDQWPWASPQQRMLWESDTYENLCKAWEDGADQARI